MHVDSPDSGNVGLLDEARFAVFTIDILDGLADELECDQTLGVDFWTEPEMEAAAAAIARRW